MEFTLWAAVGGRCNHWPVQHHSWVPRNSGCYYTKSNQEIIWKDWDIPIQSRHIHKTKIVHQALPLPLSHICLLLTRPKSPLPLQLLQRMTIKAVTTTTLTWTSGSGPLRCMAVTSLNLLPALWISVWRFHPGTAKGLKLDRIKTSGPVFAV